MYIPVAVKVPADATAVSVSALSFFQVIPWPSIAGFLSALYVLVRLYFVIKNRGKE